MNYLKRRFLQQIINRLNYGFEENIYFKDNKRIIITWVDNYDRVNKYEIKGDDLADTFIQFLDWFFDKHH